MNRLIGVKHKIIFKRLLSAVLVIAMLCSVLPCNCMAEPTEPLQKETHSEEMPPCHSSPETSEDTNNTSPEHENCCCTDGCLSIASDSTQTAIDVKANQFEKVKYNFVKTFEVASVLTSESTLIRGSPPTTTSFYTSPKTYLAQIQRWNI